MRTTKSEMEEVIASLHLKEVVLQELTNETQNRLGDIKALREQLEKEIKSDAKKE